MRDSFQRIEWPSVTLFRLTETTIWLSYYCYRGNTLGFLTCNLRNKSLHSSFHALRDLKMLSHNKMDLKRGYLLLIRYNDGYIPQEKWLRCLSLLQYHHHFFSLDLAIILELINYLHIRKQGWRFIAKTRTLN